MVEDGRWQISLPEEARGGYKLPSIGSRNYFWARFDAATTTGPVTLADLVGWRITMPAATVKWLGGLRGDAADTEQAGAFEVRARVGETGGRLHVRRAGPRRLRRGRDQWVALGHGQPPCVPLLIAFMFRAMVASLCL